MRSDALTATPPRSRVDRRGGRPWSPVRGSVTIHVSVFEYRVRGVDDAGWSAVCDDLGPAFAAVPGLLSKIWLHGGGDVRGGVYVWADRDAYRAFLASSLGQALRTHPHIADLQARDYAVDEAPTQLTRGLAAAVG